MASETNKPQNENNNDFGLPKAEFKPIESTNNNKWLKTTIIIAVVVLIIGVGIVFWFLQHSSSTGKKDFMASTLENHQDEEVDQEYDMEQDSSVGDVAYPSSDVTKSNSMGSRDLKSTKNNSGNIYSEGSSDSDKAALAELDKISDSFIVKPEQHKSSSFIEQLRAGEFGHKKQEDYDEPIIMSVTAPKGVYYVVAASYIDIDLAMDHAKKIANKDTRVKLILPEKGKHFVRLAIAQEKTFAEANQRANELKAQHGDQLWVLKY